MKAEVEEKTRQKDSHSKRHERKQSNNTPFVRKAPILGQIGVFVDILATLHLLQQRLPLVDCHALFGDLGQLVPACSRVRHHTEDGRGDGPEELIYNRENRMAKSRRYKERQINSTRPTGRARGLPSKTLPMRVELALVCKRIWTVTGQADCKLTSHFYFHAEALFWTPTSSAPTCLGLQPRRILGSHQSHLCRDLLTTTMINTTSGALDNPQYLQDCSTSAHIRFLISKRCHDGCEERPSLATEDAITQLKNLNIERMLLFASALTGNFLSVTIRAGSDNEWSLRKDFSVEISALRVSQICESNSFLHSMRRPRRQQRH
jgi:hypothetical protein